MDNRLRVKHRRVMTGKEFVRRWSDVKIDVKIVGKDGREGKPGNFGLVVMTA